MVENRIMFTLGLVDSDITSCPASIAIWKAHISANNTFAVLKICPLAVTART